MKRAVSLILALVMVLALMPAAMAANATISGKHDVTVYRVENNVTDYSTVLASKKGVDAPTTLAIEKPYDELGLSQGGKFEGEVALAEVHVTLNEDFSGEKAEVTVNGKDVALVDADKAVFFATLPKKGGIQSFKVKAEMPFDGADSKNGMITEEFTLYIDYTNNEKAAKTLNVQVAGVPDGADYTAYMVAGKLYIDFTGDVHWADVNFTFADENHAKFNQITYVNAVSGASNGEQKLASSKATFTVEGGKLKFKGETAKNEYLSAEIPVVMRGNIQPGDPKGVYFANRTQTIKIGQVVTPAVKALNDVAFNYTLSYADDTSSAIAVDGKTVTGLKAGVGYITLTSTAGGNTYTDTMKIIVLGEQHEEPTTMVVHATSLNVRRGPSTAYASMGIVKNGDELEVLSVNGGWAKINYKGQTGYVSARYLGDEEISNTYYVVCRALNVRKTASTKLARIGLLHRGDAVEVLSTNNGWAKIAYNGGVGYVSTSYIAK